MAFKIFEFILNLFVWFMLIGMAVESGIRIYWQIRNRNITIKLIKVGRQKFRNSFFKY